MRSDFDLNVVCVPLLMVLTTRSPVKLRTSYPRNTAPSLSWRMPLFSVDTLRFVNDY
jgi:hypothetical protein